jgi:galactonate dehydratase
MTTNPFSPVRITEIEAIPVRLPTPREQVVGTAGSPTPLAAGAGDYRWSESVQALYSVNFETALVKLTTDTGLVGWGEAQAPLAPQVACDIVRLLLAPVLRDAVFGGSIAEIRELWRRMYQTMRVRGQTGGFMLDAISGVDIALWDLAGQMQNRSIAAMISAAAAARVPAYLSGLAKNGVPDAAFRAVKLFHDAGEAALFARIDSLPAGVRFAVDALWRLDAASAPSFGEELDRRGALWLEAPLPPEEVAAHRELARVITTPLAVGESYRTAYEIAPFLDCARVIQPDLGRCGITEFLRIAEMARAAGAQMVPHVSIALGPQIAAAIHAAAATGCPWLEYNPNVCRVANAYLEEPIGFADAAYVTPLSFGLGVRLNEVGLRQANLLAQI